MLKKTKKEMLELANAVNPFVWKKFLKEYSLAHGKSEELTDQFLMMLPPALLLTLFQYAFRKTLQDNNIILVTVSNINTQQIIYIY